MRKSSFVAAAASVAVAAATLAGGPAVAAAPVSSSTVPLVLGRFVAEEGRTAVTAAAVYVNQSENGAPGRLVRIPFDGTAAPGAPEEVGQAVGDLAADDDEVAYVRASDRRVVVLSDTGTQTVTDVTVDVTTPTELALSDRWLAVGGVLHHRTTGATYDLARLPGLSPRTPQELRLSDDRAVFANRESMSVLRSIYTVALTDTGPSGGRQVLDPGSRDSWLVPVGVVADRIVWLEQRGDLYTARRVAVRSVPVADPGAAFAERLVGEDVHTVPVHTVGADGVVLGLQRWDAVAREAGRAEVATVPLDPARPIVARTLAGSPVALGGSLAVHTANAQLWVTDRTGRALTPPPGVPPTVRAPVPARGTSAGGTTVTLEGTGFTGVTDVSIGGRSVPFWVGSTTSMTLRTDPAPAGRAAPVTVTTVYGQASAGTFTYVDPVTFVEPWRALDTSLAPGQPHCVLVAGTGRIPAEASAVVVNLTAAQPSGPGNAVVYPSDGTSTPKAPNASTVNYEPHLDVANGSWVATGPDGRVCVESRGAKQVRMVLDVTAYVLRDHGVVVREPRRILDTRPGEHHVGELTGPLAPGRGHTVQVLDRVDVPAGAASVLLNVTVSGPTRPGNLRVAPADYRQPVETSVLNFARGADKAAGVVLDTRGSGAITLWPDTSAARDNPVHVMVDVVGYVMRPGPSDWGYVLGSHPQRRVDTRPGTVAATPHKGRVGAGKVLTVDLNGQSPLPTGAVLTLTAVGADGPGNLRVSPHRPAGTYTPPETSSLNLVPGRAVANQVVVDLPPDGLVDVYVDMPRGRSVDVVVDLVGWVEEPYLATLARD
ncbi:IPT/TIG domain-containing protein [Actinotalea sp. AC32]|nr:IPT/TIG domain-containing protein [Actinotalea sp. AC32]